MDAFQPLIEQARQASRRIVLPEGEDLRVLKAGVKAASEGLAHIILLGNIEKIDQLGKEQGLDLDPLELIDPEQSEHGEAYAHAFQQARAHKKIPLDRARKIAKDPLYFGNLMVRQRDADGCIAGATIPTPKVALAALQVMGKHEDYELVSSFFIMNFVQSLPAFQGILIFADCGFVIDPDAEQLAQIVSDTANSASRLFNLTPRVAMLSFSTDRSAKHTWVNKMVDATHKARALRPDLSIVGEVQFDAAFDLAIRARKAPDFNREHLANIFIFPNVESGNLGYKIAEYLGNAEAIGPIIQGLQYPMNDLSRGCKSEDIYKSIAVTVMQAEHLTSIERSSHALDQ